MNKRNLLHASSGDGEEELLFFLWKQMRTGCTEKKGITSRMKMSYFLFSYNLKHNKTRLPHKLNSN